MSSLRWRILPAIAVLWASGLPAATISPECLVFYVSPAGSDAWTGTLPSANEAGTDGSLATLSGARDAIRKLKASGPLPSPIEVRVRGGVYRPEEMLALGPEDSGTEDCPVSYVAYPGETPVFSGGVPITGFRPWRDEILVADLPSSLPPETCFRSLFLDGQRMIRARDAALGPSCGTIRTRRSAPPGRRPDTRLNAVPEGAY